MELAKFDILYVSSSWKSKMRANIDTCNNNQKYSELNKLVLFTMRLWVHRYLFMRNMRNHVPSHTVGMHEWGFRAMTGIGRRHGNEFYSLTRKNWMHRWPRWVCLLLLMLRFIKRNRDGVIIWNRIRGKNNEKFFQL